MTDMRLKPRNTRFHNAHCPACGETVMADEGFTRKEAAAWLQRHRRDDCPAVDNYTKAHREGLF